MFVSFFIQTPCSFMSRDRLLFPEAPGTLPTAPGGGGQGRGSSSGQGASQAHRQVAGWGFLFPGAGSAVSPEGRAGGRWAGSSPVRTAPRAEGVLLKPALRDERKLWRGSCGHLHPRDHPPCSARKRPLREAGRQDEGHRAARRRSSARGPTHSQAANDRP